jgi:spermidine synthase
VGLVYEVLWMRRLTTLFGTTTLAAAATLSGFFLGLALGSAAFGRRAKRWRRPVLAFGLLEVGVAGGALLLRPILDLYRRWYPLLYARLSDEPASFALVKLLLAVAAVGLPTFCMGGTLPVLGEAVSASGRRLGIPLGGLYAINLLGAAVGTLAVPFVLLPRLGLDLSYALAVAASLGVGLTACVVGRKAPPRAAAGSRAQGGAGEAAAAPLLALACASGVFTLALQTLWTRMFSLVHENSLHAFAVVVFVFLSGLSGGAALARWALRRGLGARRFLARAWCVAGLLVMASPRLFHGLTDGLAYVGGPGWYSSLGRLLLLALAAVLPATAALGTALPLLMDMASPAAGASAGQRIGRLLALNTAGAIAGPLLATFVMGPLLGLWWSLIVLGLLLVVAAGTALARAEIAAVAAAALAGWMALDPAGVPPVRVQASAGQRLVSVREGTHGTTAVIADAHDRWITVNNSYVLGGMAASEEERWQAHLPLLLHPAPRRVAFLGMGTGITAGAALLHPVERVVALEIVPEVVRAARADFADANHGVVDDPRVAVVVDDGRNYLASAPHAFDVIVGDLLVPWRTSEAPLYTLEHFRSARRALADGGLFCQWLPLYQLSSEQLAILLRTFVEVFPSATVWRGNFNPEAATLALIGHTGPRPVDPQAIEARLRDLASSPDPNPFLRHPAGFWIYLVGPLPPEMPWFAGARRNTDGQPWVELTSPAAHAWRGQAAPLEERVAAFLDEAARAPLAASALQVDDRQRAWRAAGAALARASLVRGDEGQRQVVEILRTLPAELQRSLELDR